MQPYCFAVRFFSFLFRKLAYCERYCASCLSKWCIWIFPSCKLSCLQGQLLCMHFFPSILPSLPVHSALSHLRRCSSLVDQITCRELIGNYRLTSTISLLLYFITLRSRVGKWEHGKNVLDILVGSWEKVKTLTSFFKHILSSNNIA